MVETGLRIFTVLVTVCYLKSKRQEEKVVRILDDQPASCDLVEVYVVELGKVAQYWRNDNRIAVQD